MYFRRQSRWCFGNWVFPLFRENQLASKIYSHAEGSENWILCIRATMGRWSGQPIQSQTGRDARHDGLGRGSLFISIAQIKIATLQAANFIQYLWFKKGRISANIRIEKQSTIQSKENSEKEFKLATMWRRITVSAIIYTGRWHFLGIVFGRVNGFEDIPTLGGNYNRWCTKSDLLIDLAVFWKGRKWKGIGEKVDLNLDAGRSRLFVILLISE